MESNIQTYDIFYQNYNEVNPVILHKNIFIKFTGIYYFSYDIGDKIIFLIPQNETKLYCLL